MKFTKWHGLGNDFVLVNGLEERIDDYASLAKIVCDRHFGVGADGLVFALPSAIADFQMRIFNSDGSEAEMCGNVTRCFARFVFESGLTDKTELSLETLAGIIKPRLIFSEGKVDSVCVDMGEPRLKRAEIPMTGEAEAQAINVPIEVCGDTFTATCVSMGNPHCVIFVDDLEKIDLPRIGRAIEIHEMFPRKTNVEFAQMIDPQTIRMRVWERGAGITLACGTGSCATLVAAALTGRSKRSAVLQLDGGELLIEWREDNRVYKTGPAVEVFRGEFLG